MLEVEQRQLQDVAGRYLRRFDQRESFCPLPCLTKTCHGSRLTGQLRASTRLSSKFIVDLAQRGHSSQMRQL